MTAKGGMQKMMRGLGELTARWWHCRVEGMSLSFKHISCF